MLTDIENVCASFKGEEERIGSWDEQIKLFVGWMNKVYVSTGNCKLGAKWQQRPGPVSALPTHGEDAYGSAFHPLQVQQDRPSQASLGEKDSDQQLQCVSDPSSKPFLGTS